MLQLKATDCENNEIHIGDYIKGAMSELWFILKEKHKVVDIIFDKHREGYAQIEGKEGYWHIKQCIKVI